MAKSRITKGRTNLRSKTEKVLAANQEIDVAMKETLLYIINDMGIKQRAEYFKSFPPSVISSLFNQFIPKQRDTNQELQQSHISLLASYERLPQVEDLTAKIQALHSQLKKVTYQLQQTEYLLKGVFHRNDSPYERRWNRKGIRSRMLHLFNKIQKDLNTYISEKNEQYIPQDEYVKLLDDYLALYPDYGPRAPTPITKRADMMVGDDIVEHAEKHHSTYLYEKLFRKHPSSETDS